MRVIVLVGVVAAAALGGWFILDRYAPENPAVSGTPAGSTPTVSPGVDSGGMLSERDKIERMLQTLEKSNAVFIRSGSEYSGAEAAAHLRRKWSVAGDRITTAREFIAHLASRSSATGAPYQIRADGTLTESGPWFHRLLESLDAPAPGK